MNLNDYPESVQFDFKSGTFAPCERKTIRRVSDLGMMYQDKGAVKKAIGEGDPVIYEIWYRDFPTSRSDMGLGVSRIYPGKVGSEYYMTKGHYHERDDQPEIYFCVKGQGYLILETEEGQFRSERWVPGTISHIPPMWAHRVVNIGDEMLVFVATYHLSAGHNHKPIEERGFAQIVAERDGRPVFLPNERRRK